MLQFKCLQNEGFKTCELKDVKHVNGEDLKHNFNGYEKVYSM